MRFRPAASFSLAALLAAPAVFAPAALAAPAPFMLAARDAAVAGQVAELLQAGQKNLADGLYEQALSIFQEADSLAPEDPEIQALLREAQTKACAKYVAEGNGLLAVKDYAQAGYAFDSALEILPQDPEAKKGKRYATNGPKADNYLKVAKEELAKAQYDKAIAYLEKAFALVDSPAIAQALADAKAKKSKK